MVETWRINSGENPMDAEEGNSDKETNTEGSNRGKAIRLLEEKVVENPQMIGENKGIKTQQNNNIQSLLPQNMVNKSYNSRVDPNELIIADPKRRRMDITYGPDITESLDSEMVPSPQENESSNQKNLFLASAVLQARHSS